MKPSGKRRKHPDDEELLDTRPDHELTDEFLITLCARYGYEPFIREED